MHCLKTGEEILMQFTAEIWLKLEKKNQQYICKSFFLLGVFYELVMFFFYILIMAKLWIWKF